MGDKKTWLSEHDVIPENAFHNILRRTKKFSGMSVAELRRLHQIKKESTQLKKLVANLSLDKQMLQNVIKKAVRSRKKRELVNYPLDAYRVSIRRACQTVQ